MLEYNCVKKITVFSSRLITQTDLQASLSTYHGDDDTSYYSKYGVRHNYTW